MQVQNIVFIVLTICMVKLVVTAKENEETELEVLIKDLLDRVTALEDIIAEKTEVVDRLEDAVKKLQNNKIRADTAVASYAFTAFLDKVVTSPAPNQPIIFNKILMNRGLAYNTSNGKFKCPQGGLYLFSYTLESDAPGHVVTKLIVDGLNQVNAVNGQYQNGGNSAVVGLEAGQEVWVALDGGNATIWNSDKYRYSTFSGFSLP